MLITLDMEKLIKVVLNVNENIGKGFPLLPQKKYRFTLKNQESGQKS